MIQVFQELSDMCFMSKCLKYLRLSVLFAILANGLNTGCKGVENDDASLRSGEGDESTTTDEDFSTVSGMTEDDERFTGSDEPTQISGTNLRADSIKIEKIAITEAGRVDITTVAEAPSTSGDFEDQLKTGYFHIVHFKNFKALVPIRATGGTVTPIGIVLNRHSTASVELFMALISDPLGKELVKTGVLPISPLLKFGELNSRARIRGKSVSKETIALLASQIVATVAAQNAEFEKAGLSTIEIKNVQAKSVLTAYPENVAEQFDVSTYSQWSTASAIEEETETLIKIMADIETTADVTKAVIVSISADPESASQAQDVMGEFVVSTTIEALVIENNFEEDTKNTIYKALYSALQNLTLEELRATANDTEKESTAYSDVEDSISNYSSSDSSIEEFTEILETSIEETEESNSIAEGANNAPSPGNGGTLGLVADSTTQITVSFTDATDGEDYATATPLLYQLWRSTTNNITTIADAQTNGTNSGNPMYMSGGSHAVTGLTLGTNYYFTLVVSDSSGNKALYPMVNISTLADGAPSPGNSGTLGLAANSTTQITVSFTDATDVEDEATATPLFYQLWRSTTNNITTIADAQTNGTNSGNPMYMSGGSHAVTGLTPGTNYYFTLVVSDSSGNKALYPMVNISTLL